MTDTPANRSPEPGPRSDGSAFDPRSRVVKYPLPSPPAYAVPALAPTSSDDPRQESSWEFGFRSLMVTSLLGAVLTIAQPVGLSPFLFVAMIVFFMTGVFFAAQGRKPTACFLAALVCLLAGLLAPASKGARAAPPTAQCKNNLFNVMRALELYQDTYGQLPPPYVADENGRPMHSWRVLLLPFLDRRDLYERYRFDEPWDGPSNRQLHQQTMKIFRCNGEPPLDSVSTSTNYLAVIGPEACWAVDQATKLSEPDAPQRILVVEVSKSGIHWMEPRDMHTGEMTPAVNSPEGQGPSSLHPEHGAHVGLSSGKVRFLPSSMPRDEFRRAVRVGLAPMEPGAHE